MGQTLVTIRDKLQGREWKERQIRKISDKVFDRIKDDTRNALTFQDIYIAVLLVYNDLNKHMPGPYHDPPTKEKLKALMEEHDANLDGLLDREEFAKFIRELTADTITMVSQKLVIALIMAPTLALVTKRATERVPGVGKTVEKIPNSVYASIITLGVVLIQNSCESC